MTTTTNTPLAEHLCVLIHGLWGNPDHLKYVAESLSDHLGKDEITTLVCKSNAGGFTYDGIDVCALRATQEIKDHMKDLSEKGHQIKKFSIVGYSLGGLVARYAIGILDDEGFFETVEPVNFTTFASPHLGARSTLSEWSSHLYNTFGSRVVSASGQQMFLLDNFHDIGRPLLAVMADPDSIFMHALSKFEKRTIYANIVNDRLASFYTTAISSTDPYSGELDKLKLNYIEGYGEVVIDGKDPYRPLNEEELKNIPTERSCKGSVGTNLAMAARIAVAISLFLPAFLAGTAVETHRSQGRIRVVLKDSKTTYAIRHLSQKTAKSLKSGAKRLTRVSSVTNDSQPSAPPRSASVESFENEPSMASSAQVTDNTYKHKKLTLLPCQRAMVDSFNEVSLDKFHVHIHNTIRSHAAIVVRGPNTEFDEGKLVVKHWVETQFRS